MPTRTGRLGQNETSEVFLTIRAFGLQHPRTGPSRGYRTPPAGNPPITRRQVLEINRFSRSNQRTGSPFSDPMQFANLGCLRAIFGFYLYLESRGWRCCNRSKLLFAPCPCPCSGSAPPPRPLYLTNFNLEYKSHYCETSLLWNPTRRYFLVPRSLPRYKCFCLLLLIEILYSFQNAMKLLHDMETRPST